MSKYRKGYWQAIKDLALYSTCFIGWTVIFTYALAQFLV